MKFQRWHWFPVIFIIWFTQTAALCDPAASSTGADITVNGDNNLICNGEQTSQEDSEINTVDCSLTPPQAVTPETPGTSQLEPIPE